MNISVFCGSSIPHKNEIIIAACTLGHLLAERGDTLLYGGSNLGLMGEVSGAALRSGGKVVAVIPTIFSEAIINSQAVTELIRVRSMAERKEYLIAHSDAFIALPGGIGTLDEVLEVLVANQLQQISKPIVLYNPEGFFNPFLEQIERMNRDGFFRSGKKAELVVSDNVEEMIALIG